jgi:hypothetical protein
MDIAASSSSRVRAAAKGQGNRGVSDVGNGVGEDALRIESTKGIRPESARGRASPLSSRRLEPGGSHVGGDIDVPRGGVLLVVERPEAFGRPHGDGGPRTPPAPVLLEPARRREPWRTVLGGNPGNRVSSAKWIPVHFGSPRCQPRANCTYDVRSSAACVTFRRYSGLLLGRVGGDRLRGGDATGRSPDRIL